MAPSSALARSASIAVAIVFPASDADKNHGRHGVSDHVSKLYTMGPSGYSNMCHVPVWVIHSTARHTPQLAFCTSAACATSCPPTYARLHHTPA